MSRAAGRGQCPHKVGKEDMYRLMPGTGRTGHGQHAQNRYVSFQKRHKNRIDVLGQVYGKFCMMDTNSVHFDLQICTDFELECQTVCKKYETGCANECAMYKTKYYEERMEPLIEEVHACLDVETQEFMVGVAESDFFRAFQSFS